MDVGRREAVKTLAVTAAAVAARPLVANGQSARARDRHIQAVAFDGFVIFDPRSVNRRAEEVFPGKGVELANLWRARQFEYSWLVTAGNRYVDFWQVTEDALRYTAASLKLPLTNTNRSHLMDSYRELQPWPDVPKALAELKRSGVRMALLSNFTAAMLDANLAPSKLDSYFEPHLTTDRVRAFKPSPRAYQMGPDAFGLMREEVAFAAFGAWDAVGAKWFGYPTVWVNRLGVPEEELGAHPDAITQDIQGLLNFIEL
jgi:2-haloacid dehalogenase